jgi:hypothetical protein
MNNFPQETQFRRIAELVTEFVVTSAIMVAVAVSTLRLLGILS